MNCCRHRQVVELAEHTPAFAKQNRSAKTVISSVFNATAYIAFTIVWRSFRKANIDSIPDTSWLHMQGTNFSTNSTTSLKVRFCYLFMSPWLDDKKKSLFQKEPIIASKWWSIIIQIEFIIRLLFFDYSYSQSIVSIYMSFWYYVFFSMIAKIVQCVPELARLWKRCSGGKDRR